jgi:hypothetical protein
LNPIHPSPRFIRLSDCIDYPLVIAGTSSAIRPYLDAAFTRAAIDLRPVIETNAIEIMRHTAILNNGHRVPHTVRYRIRAPRGTARLRDRPRTCP